MLDIPKVIAHRGASADAPENTIVAFKQAKFMGAAMVEFDVALCGDGTPVVLHDENIKRTTNGRGLVNTFSFEELQNFDAGKWYSKKYLGEKIPSFQAALEFCDAFDLMANVEIKPVKGTELETTAAVMSHINQFWPEENAPLLISSFDFNVLEMVRSFSPEQPIGLLLHKWEVDWQTKVDQLNCVSVHLNQRIITQDRIDALKASGMKILSYTVNRASKANKLFDMGVDGIFTDYVELLKS
jgi:glycerophosphoryl diester phosphodiesterase